MSNTAVHDKHEVTIGELRSRGAQHGSGSFWLPVFTLWQRELLRFWREKARVLGFVGSPLVFWFLVGSGFGDLGFYFPGALILTVMFSAVFSTMSLIEDRREGFLLSMLASPAPRTSMVLGKVLGSSTLAWVQGLIFLAFVPFTGLRPSAIDLIRLAGAILLISFMFTVLGFFIAWQMDSTQGFHAIINLLLLPLWLISSAVFPVAGAHGWVRWLMWLNPVTYTVALVRHLLGPAADGSPRESTSLAVTAVISAVLLVAATAVANRRNSRSFA